MIKIVNLFFSSSLFVVPMASTLTSNSFLLTSAPNTRLTIKFKTKRLRVFAKKAGGEAEADDKAGNSSPFRFDFGKVPDVKSLIPVVSSPASGLSFGARRKDAGTVFVAGATGLAGIRIAQSLLRKGFTVRAGVSELGAAQELARLAAKYKIISNEESRRLNAVESTFNDAESIAKAIGNASKVVVTISSGEDGPSQQVTISDALRVIEAADLAGVGHVAIIYDGSSANPSTYNVLDGLSSFFNNLFSRSQPLSVPQFLQKVVATNVSYTFIKTSLTEDFSPESAYNVVVSAEGSAGANDYKVAKSQIASVVADVFSNTAVAENKVVEVFTDPSAPSRPIDDLFSAIPKDGRRAAYAEAQAKAKAEEEARTAEEKAREAAVAAKKLEKEVKKLSEKEAQAASFAEEAQEKAEAAGASIEGLFKDIGSGFSWDKLSAQLATTIQNSQEKEEKEKAKVQIATVRGRAKAQSLPSLKAIVKSRSASKPKEQPKKGKQTEAKPAEVRNVFGGLFKQETIYVDDD